MKCLSCSKEGIFPENLCLDCLKNYQNWSFWFYGDNEEVEDEE